MGSGSIDKGFCRLYQVSVLLDAYSHLYKRPYPSVGRLVHWSVGPLVRNAFVKIDEKWPFMDSK